MVCRKCEGRQAGDPAPAMAAPGMGDDWSKDRSASWSGQSSRDTVRPLTTEPASRGAMTPRSSASMHESAFPLAMNGAQNSNASSSCSASSRSLAASQIERTEVGSTNVLSGTDPRRGWPLETFAPARHLGHAGCGDQLWSRSRSLLLTGDWKFIAANNEGQ